jgi:chloride anion exchanger 3
MAYSLLATLPAVNGLYISFFPLLIYFFLGTSTHLAIGAVSLVSLLSGTTITKMVNDYETETTMLSSNNSNFTLDYDEYRIRVASSLSLLVGIIQVLLGMSGLGVLASYFSDTFISSYTCASAIHVIVSQLKDLFGIKTKMRFKGAFKIPKVN